MVKAIKCLAAVAPLIFSSACGNIAAHNQASAAARSASQDRVAVGVDAEPRGYLIANFTVFNEEPFNQYRSDVRKFFGNFQGKMIMRDTNAIAMEGDAAKQVMAIIEFSNLGAAKKYYFSPEYTAAKKNRITATDSLVALASGVQGVVSEQTNPARGYLIVNYSRRDIVAVNEHLEKIKPLLETYNGRFISSDGNAEVVEGSRDQLLAIIDFPGISYATKFYRSLEYTALRQSQIPNIPVTIVIGNGMPG
ncbi:DUF1330 domain-containing protein [Xylophilus sp. GW821-FHT01B05]